MPLIGFEDQAGHQVRRLYQAVISQGLYLLASERSSHPESCSPSRADLVHEALRRRQLHLMQPGEILPYRLRGLSVA
jgi:hypothetical protein